MYCVIYWATESMDIQRGSSACVVSKKVAASAVERHRLQRRLRESVRLLKKEYGDRPAMVILAKPSIKSASGTTPVLESMRMVYEKAH